LKSVGDIFLFDTSPLLPVTEAAALALLTDGAVVVFHFWRTRSDQLARATESLRSVGATVLGVVLNRVSGRRSGSYDRLDYAYFNDGSTTRRAARHNPAGTPV
jgi:receptor protein-tyrosine kinase